MFWHVSVCLSTGGVPISHNALQHYPEFHGADTWGGSLPGGVPCQGGYPARGGGTLLGGVPCRGGGTQVGQQKEYSLHGGRYASSVHTGGLSCYILKTYSIWLSNMFLPGQWKHTWQSNWVCFWNKHTQFSCRVCFFWPTSARNLNLNLV